jgi:malate dehydrogenase (oxaloacetate-decarboxylating)
VSYRGKSLLDTPLLNKGTAFTEQERTDYGLQGLLPPQVETLDQQVARAYHAFLRKDDDLERHIYLRALQDTNEVLFYRLLLDHIEEMMPIVYTPVVALACEHFSGIYRRPRGIFVSFPLRGDIPTLLRNRPNSDVDVIVVTDGERILGIGDQGAGGLGIPIGKLALYTLIGGIDPARTLPVILDVGTNNRERLDDPEYLGWHHERITGEAYHDFIDLFVAAVKLELPKACLQWEDFAGANARPILERYRDQLLTFNDDIQGTAAVALGALLGAVQVTGRPLVDQTIVVLGAGAAAIGVADCIRKVMVADGLSDRAARERFWVINRGGVLHAGRTDLNEQQQIYAQPVDRLASWRLPATNIGLAEVIRHIDATVLIGLSTVGGAFGEATIREMARRVERPIVFPLSNPTSHSEATADEVMRWTDGRALIATGSPFAPLHIDGRMVRVSQCNNVYIFPALGLGLVASQARRVTDGMILAAARALGERSPALRDAAAPLLPALGDLRSIAPEIAFAVGRQAQLEGVAPIMSEDELRERVSHRWMPSY